MTAKELRELRRSLGWTQKRLAARIGKGRLYVIKREKGQLEISPMMSLAVRCVALHLGQ